MAETNNSSDSPKEFEESATSEAWRAAHGENRAILEEAARKVRFIDFPDVPFYRFKQLLFLVILDYTTQDSEEEKAKRAKLEDTELDLVRESPEYQSLYHRFLEELEAQRHPQTFADHLSDLPTQDRIARSLIKDTLYDNDGRVRTQAGKVLADRAMAPKREVQEMRHVFMRADEVKRLSETEQQLIDAGESLVVDAEVEEEE